MVHNQWVIALRLVRAALLGLATAVVALAQLHLPSENFWTKYELLQWLSVFVLAFFILAEGVASVSSAVQASRIREYDNDVRTTLTAAVVQVVQITGSPWDEVAARYYRLRGRWLWQRLTVVTAIEAGARVSDAQRSIRPGVGVVGVAVTSQEGVVERWREFAQAATQEGREAWEKRAASSRYGLSWGQLRRSIKAEGVVAFPTFDASGDLANGCILLSGAVKLEPSSVEKIQDILESTATSLDKAGPPPRGWWAAHDT